MTVTPANILSFFLFSCDIITVSVFINSTLNGLKKFMVTKENTENQLPKMAEFKFDIFTQKKNEWLGTLCLGLPLLTIIVIIISTEVLGKSDIFMLSVCPCLILFYITFSYFSSVIVRTIEINQIMFAKIVAKLAKQPITIKTSSGDQTFH
jgi:hypothetical protein